MDSVEPTLAPRRRATGAEVPARPHDDRGLGEVVDPPQPARPLDPLDGMTGELPRAAPVEEVVIELEAADAVARHLVVAGSRPCARPCCRSGTSGSAAGTRPARYSSVSSRSVSTTAGVTHPAHTLSRGKSRLSMTATSRPARRSCQAQVEPAGPPPITMASNRSKLPFLPSDPIRSLAPHPDAAKGARPAPTVSDTCARGSSAPRSTSPARTPPGRAEGCRW